MPDDPALDRAAAQVASVRAGELSVPAVTAFFDEPTFTASYVVSDPATGRAAIIDSVLAFDPASGRTSTAAADAILDHVQAEGLTVDWILETHAHADHLTAAQYLQDKAGGRIGIGTAITAVQSAFSQIFNDDIACDGSQFDRLFADGDTFAIGSVPVTVLHVPGHTPADVAYIIGDAAVIGDTMFMPDYGSARCDFPGGDARHLYRSVRRLMRLPDETRLFLCHDYKAPGRDCFAWETTVGTQRRSNVHVHDGVDEDGFVAMRTGRDETLPVPKLLIPAIQVNLRAGRMPQPEANGTSYLKLPLNSL